MATFRDVEQRFDDATQAEKWLDREGKKNLREEKLTSLSLRFAAIAIFVMQLSGCEDGDGGGDGYDGGTQEDGESTSDESEGNGEESSEEGREEDSICESTTLRIEPIVADFMLRPENQRLEYPCIRDPNGFNGTVKIERAPDGVLMAERAIVCEGEGMELGALPPGSYVMKARVYGHGIVFLRGWIGDECEELLPCEDLDEISPCVPRCFQVAECGKTTIQLRVMCSSRESVGIEDACGF